jgi:hypothetical protein
MQENNKHKLKCLIFSVNERKGCKVWIKILATRCHKVNGFLVFQQLFTFYKVLCSIEIMVLSLNSWQTIVISVGSLVMLKLLA